MAALRPSESPEGDGCRVLGWLWRKLNLSGGELDDLKGSGVRVAWESAWALRHTTMVTRKCKSKPLNLKLGHYRIGVVPPGA